MPDYIVPGTETRIALADLSPGDYEVTVAAIGEAGEGTASAAEAFTILADPSSGPRVVTRPAALESGGSAQFSGLPAGDYEVTVEAENDAGWGPASAAVPFTITDELVRAGYRLADVELFTPNAVGPVVLPGGSPPLRHALSRLTRQREVDGAAERASSVTLELVSGALALADELVEERVIRLTWEHDSGQASQRRYELYRIEAIDDDLAGGSGSFSVRARAIEDDLADTIATDDLGPDSASIDTVSPYVSLYDLDAQEALAAVLSDFGTAGNRDVPIVAALAPDSITGERVTISGEGLSHIDLLRMLAEAVGGRLRFSHRAGSVEVALVSVPDLSAADPVATIGQQHTFSLRRSRDARGLVTTLVPLGGPEGEAWTVGRVEWQVVGVISGDRLVLATPGPGRPGRRSPIWADDALVGTYLILPDGSAAQVTDTSAPNIVVCAGSAFDFGDVGSLVRFAADADGTEFVRLTVPNLPDTGSGVSVRNERVRRYADAVPVPNLLERSAVSADFDTLTGWLSTTGSESLLVTEVVTQASDPSLVRHGRRAQRLVATGVGQGIESVLCDLDVHEAPYASAWMALHVESGKWLVELVDSTGQVFGAREEDEGWIDAGAEAYALAGMEVRSEDVIGGLTSARRVKLRVSCIELPSDGGPAAIVLDAATLTQSAVEVPYRSGLGPHEVWIRAMDELRHSSRFSGSGQRAEYAGEIVDPQALAALPPIEVGDVVELEYQRAGAAFGTTDAVQLPVVSIEGELAVGARETVRRVRLGVPEASAATEIGGALGLPARPGSATWMQPRGLPETTSLLAARPRLARRYP